MLRCAQQRDHSILDNGTTCEGCDATFCQNSLTTYYCYYHSPTCSVMTYCRNLNRAQKFTRPCWNVFTAECEQHDRACKWGRLIPYWLLYQYSRTLHTGTVLREVQQSRCAWRHLSVMCHRSLAKLTPNSSIVRILSTIKISQKSTRNLSSYSADKQTDRQTGVKHYPRQPVTEVIGNRRRVQHALVWLEVAVYDAVAVKIFQRQHHFSRVHSAHITYG